MFNVRSAVLATTALLIAAPALAGETILTVSGAVGASDQGETWSFDLAALQEMGSASFETETIWTEGTQTFEGVPLVTLLEHVGATGNELRALALNDYAVSIPASDAVEDGPIVAYHHNGEEMSVRSKGPLWIVYPYDDNETYQSEEFYSRSIWQLDRIEVLSGN